MLRILGCISVNGKKENIEEFSLTAKMMNGSIKQLGLKRKTPEIDHWCYSSPWYQFNPEKFDEEIYDFVIKNLNFGKAMEKYNSELTYPLLTICPTDMNEEEVFSFFLSEKTIKEISNIGVGIQMSPALNMPEFPFWSVKNTAL